MFTGIVQGLGIVLLSPDSAAGKRMTVSMAELSNCAVRPGDSIAVSGVCLTALRMANGHVAFDVVGETLARTTLGEKKSGDRVNLELPLLPNQHIGGHFVQGHIDAVVTVLSVQEHTTDWRITFSLPEECQPAVVPKGSVALDGVSMTIASVEESQFSVAVIPTTLHATTLGALVVGDRVNMETDILARAVAHNLQLAVLKAPEPTRVPAEKWRE